MEINHLKYFYATAKEKGFSRAAMALKVAQPSISLFVKKLEEEIGGALFERGAREVRLTKLGADLFRHCEIIFGEFERIKQDFVKSSKAIVSGNASFGASEVVARYIVPFTAKILAKHYPEIYLWIATGQSMDLCSKVENNILEMAWLFHIPELGSRLTVRQIYPVSYAVVIAASQVKSKRALTSFIGSREVDNTSVIHYPTLKRLQRDYPDARITISTNSFSAHKEMVLNGLGVSVLPRFMVADELKKGNLKELYAKEKFEFQLKLVARFGHVFSSQAQVVVDAMAEAIKRQNAGVE